MATGQTLVERVMMQILVNEDDLATRKMLRFVLEQQAGHSVTEAESSEAALQHLAGSAFDLLVSDVMLPGTDGIELIRRVRRFSSIPILLVSARGEITDRVRGLRVGADDYLVKPFDPSELAARVEALLRRSRYTARGDLSGMVRVGDIQIDITRQLATVADRGPIHLTPTEMRVLLRLAQPPGQVRSRAELAQAVWGDEQSPSTEAINTYIADLRRKLEPEPGRPRLLRTVRGSGYRLAV
jgi:DNA-binding response OmpR family regulator